MAGGYTAVKGGPEGIAARFINLQRQIDEIRAAAGLKSAVIRGNSIRFEDENGDLNAVIGMGSSKFYNDDAITTEIGEFDGFYWDVDAEVFVGDIVRGIALTRVGDQYPFFLVGHAQSANRVDLAAGYGSVKLASIDLQADHFAVRTASGGSRLSLNPAGSGDVILEADSPSNDVFLGFSTSGVTISPHPSSQGLRMFNLGSHAVPANLSISANVVRVVSSAAKYKADVEDLVVDRDELFAVSGKTYVDAGEKERHAADPELAAPIRYPGFIADEWAEHETLRQFVRFEDGQVEGFHYDRVSAALLEVAKQQQAEIDELKNQVAKLLTRLDAKEI